MNTEQPTHEDGHNNSVVRRKRRQIRSYSAAQRQAYLAAFDQCNEGAKEFCARHGIHPSTFKGWQSRSRRRSSSAGFARLELPLAMPSPIEVTFPSGVRVGIRPHGSRDELIGLIRGVAGC